MVMTFLADLSYAPKPVLPIHQITDTTTKLFNQRKCETAVRSRDQRDRFTASAAKGGSFSLNSVFQQRCDTCRGQGAVECSGCKGTGRNKKNGNIFERWKCFDCQGFGLKRCPECGTGGLTPEQRGER